MELSCHITLPTQSEQTLLLGKIKKHFPLQTCSPEHGARNVCHQHEYELSMYILFKNLMF